MNAYHCDADGCDHWQQVDADAPIFYVLTDPNEEETHFCSLNCVLLWAAKYSPVSKARATEHVVRRPSDGS